jgi:hypothetical protein
VDGLSLQLRNLNFELTQSKRQDLPADGRCGSSGLTSLCKNPHSLLPKIPRVPYSWSERFCKSTILFLSCRAAKFLSRILLLVNDKLRSSKSPNDKMVST